MTPIDSFSGEHRFLSNFWPVTIAMPLQWALPLEVKLGQDQYASVEHAYQACKSLDAKDRLWVRWAPTAGKAKQRAQKVTLRDDWESIKLDVMWDMLVVKFDYPEMRSKLLSTGSAELIEGNTWNDTFWGVCRGVGQNYLGRLLMDIRAGHRLRRT